MKNKILKALISFTLCFALFTQMATPAFAAKFTGKTYIKEIILSYGKDEESAKNWLKENNYKIIDHNINEGADDTFSTKRAVYIGYKTTSNAEEAITDIKLMNMKGGYSLRDYQVMLDEQKANIQAFIDNFIVAINEYRKNYKNGQERAKAAYEILNLMYDDDTEQTLGDLFLNKIKEEYTADEYNKLSKDEKSKIADMTTILMQSNATSVLAIEQTIALATDDKESVWTERYMNIPSYDSMVEKLMDEENLAVSDAVLKLSEEYDDDAKLIASKVQDYINYLNTYTESGLSLKDSEEKINKYKEENGAFDLSLWYTVGTQYEGLKAIVDEDGLSLFDILVSGDYDVTTDDRYLLYPLVSVLTEGQRACLDFLTLFQLVSMGFNDDDAIKKAVESTDLGKRDDTVSIYEGVDRGIFSDDVAMTGDAYALQNSTGKDASSHWFSDGISETTKILYLSFGVSVIASIGSFVTSSLIYNMGEKAADAAQKLDQYMTEAVCETIIEEKAGSEILEVAEEFAEGGAEALENSIISNASEQSVEMVEGISEVAKVQDEAMLAIGETRYWSSVLHYVGIATAAISVIIMSFSIWRTIEDLRAYYNADFTPIPKYMVNQGISDTKEKVYTYYTAVRCNRQQANMITDKTKVLKSFGDINGDVGKQWVAVYTTTDKAAGNPITDDFVVQYANPNIPNESTPLSLFGEKVAQNLTNNKNGFTYDDDKGGIYLFYNVDNSAYAGSAISTGAYALIAGGCAIILAAISFFVSKKIMTRKGKENG